MNSKMNHLKTRRYWCLEQKIFLVEMIQLQSSIVNEDLSPVKEKQYWDRTSQKFKSEFGFRLPGSWYKQRWDKMKVDAKAHFEKIKKGIIDVNLLKEPGKTVVNILYKHYFESNGHDENGGNVKAQNLTNQTSQSQCNWNPHHNFPFTISGRFWIEDWLEDGNINNHNRCFEDERVKEICVKWHEESRKYKYEENQITKKMLEIRNKGEKLKLEILQIQHEEAKLKVENAKIKRAIMELMFSEAELSAEFIEGSESRPIVI